MSGATASCLNAGTSFQFLNSSKSRSQPFPDMCGIFATAFSRVSAEQACRALCSLQHRGPDGKGTWSSEKHGVLLGHRRLSIIDLPGGQQPIMNEAGNIVAIVNGEFYGYEKTMIELTARGHQFRTHCDSEILVHLYEEHGLDAIHNLRGEFAFVLWDEKHARLVAGRDRFGVKPLFYALVNGGLWLASEAKALFAAGFTAEWDEEAFFHHLFFVHEGGRSLFSGVRQLEAGHLLMFEDGKLTVNRYWDLDYPVRHESELADPEELIHVFWERLNDAIRVRLRADTPVSYFLSGGIDSSTVLGVASQHWHAPGRAFTVRFDQPEYDEGEQAHGTATGFGADYSPVALSHRELVDAYPEAIAKGETTGNLHAAARYLQCRAVHEAGYKVALTGDGADEVLAGYVHYASDVSGHDAQSLPIALRPLHQKLGHVPQWIRMLAIERSVFNLLLRRDYRERMQSCHPYEECLETLDFDGQLARRDPLHQSLYIWSKTMLPNYVLVAERLEMAFAVETRPPFLDHLLFDVIRRIPSSALVAEHQGKQTLRLAARGLLPEAVIAQRKHPFAAPLGLAQPDSALFRKVDEVFRSGIFHTMPFFEARAVLDLWTQIPELPVLQRAALEPALLMIFCACVLHQRYISN